jgi:hypothetical protein
LQTTLGHSATAATPASQAARSAAVKTGPAFTPVWFRTIVSAGSARAAATTCRLEDIVIDVIDVIEDRLWWGLPSWFFKHPTVARLDDKVILIPRCVFH